MFKALRCLSLLILCINFAACTAQTRNVGYLPTSERLENVKTAKMPALQDNMTNQSLVLGAPVFLRVFKYENTLEAWVKMPETDQYQLYQSYPICNYSGALGPKTREGDHQAPEGFYKITADQMNPWSKYHLSFNIGFPNQYDMALGRTGTNLMVHGGCKSEGCFAITDEAIEDVYLLTEASIAAGHTVPIHIFPFRMTPRMMAKTQTHKHTPFWRNLKQGYDAFEIAKIPPKVSTTYRQNRAYYIFEMPKNTKTQLF